MQLPLHRIWLLKTLVTSSDWRNALHIQTFVLWPGFFSWQLALNENPVTHDINKCHIELSISTYPLSPRIMTLRRTFFLDAIVFTCKTLIETGSLKSMTLIKSYQWHYCFFKMLRPNDQLQDWVKITKNLFGPLLHVCQPNVKFNCQTRLW